MRPRILSLTAVVAGVPQSPAGCKRERVAITLPRVYVVAMVVVVVVVVVFDRWFLVVVVFAGGCCFLFCSILLERELLVR